jgi:sulfide:quinone oxidoreductase
MSELETRTTQLAESHTQETSSEVQSPAAWETRHHQVVIVGGGTGGISVAARLCRGWFNNPDVAVIEPSEHHFYQPLWTLVGGGAAAREKSVRNESSVMPKKANWIRDSVESFEPEHNFLITRQGKKITYDFLVLSGGIEANWGAIPGLKESLGSNGICSNYSFEHVNYTWQMIETFAGGTAIFTHPLGAIKCGGAPQKICYLAEDHFRRKGVREQSQLVFAVAKPVIFDVKKYADRLMEIVAERKIDVRFNQNLVELRPETKEAVFEHIETGERNVVAYDMIHVTPPMQAPTFLATSPLAGVGGWVDVDRHTLQHSRFDNVFALGDCTSLPTSKTGAAIRKQAPVLVRNLKAVMEGKPLPASYDGYTSCPIVTGYGKLILAEFDYDRKPTETFPFDQSRERWSMWLLKKFLLPPLYWYGMLKGRA